MEPAVDIVIPVYNEGDKIHEVLDMLAAGIRDRFRVLICYDRDDDNTLPALRNYSAPAGARAPEIVPVKNQIERGPHGAVLSGFRASQAPAVIVVPADDNYNGRALQAMIREFQDNQSEIVCASRFMPGGCMEGAPLAKAFLVRAAAITLRHLARLPTHDPSNGLRLFSRRVLDEIPIESTMGFTYSIELLVKAHRLGWRISEVPAKWFERRTGQSRFQVWKWLLPYLRWYFHAFGTLLIGKRKPEPQRIDARAGSEA